MSGFSESIPPCSRVGRHLLRSRMSRIDNAVFIVQSLRPFPPNDSCPRLSGVGQRAMKIGTILAPAFT
eukprot:scaffold5691_cov81-Skeletonema_dohrnii-CCMP3373.AAC.6